MKRSQQVINKRTANQIFKVIIMKGVRSTEAHPLFLSFATREKMSFEAEEAKFTAFVYDPVNQITYYMGGSSHTACKRCVKRGWMSYDVNKEVKDDEC